MISKMNAKEFMAFLIKYNACEEGIEFSKGKTALEVWNTCHRGDWLFWLLAKAKVDLKTMTGLKVKVVRLVQHLIKDERSLKALDVAERFSKGLATKKELGAAYAASAASAAYAYAAYAYAYAAYAYAAAAYAAAADDAAADDAADAAADAAAADAAAADAAKKSMQLKQANVIRENFNFSKI